MGEKTEKEFSHFMLRLETLFNSEQIDVIFDDYDDYIVEVVVIDTVNILLDGDFLVEIFKQNEFTIFDFEKEY